MNYTAVCLRFASASALLMCLSACSAESEETPDPYGGAPRGRLRVTEGKLVDGKGKRLALKGLGLAALDQVKSVGHWNEKYFADAKSWGAELVRLPVNPFSFRVDREQTLLDLDDAARWCRAHDLYLIIDYHIIGNVPQGLFLFEESTATTWPEVHDFWATVSERYANDPIVAFYEIYNEPTALEFMGGTWAFADWRRNADEIVTLIRQHAPRTVPLVAGLDYASDYSQAGEKPFESPDIALTAHPYPGMARSDRRTVWDAKFGHLSDRYPFVFTELGFDPYDQILPRSYRDDLPYGRELVAYAEEKHISWAAFVFYNGPGWPMPLFSDWATLTPTVSGLFFKDLLSGKSIATAGDGFENRPPVVDPPGNGPSNLFWNKWADVGASTEWLVEPNATAVAVHITAGPMKSAGMFAELFWDGTAQDASQYNQLVFDGTVAEGSPFAVTLGRTVNSIYYGCSWSVAGKGTGTYTVDLTTPGWCGPTACFDLQAAGIGFNNQWSTSASAVDIRVERVELKVDPTRALPAQGRIGTGSCE